MIFKRYDCVVTDDGRIGRIDRHYYMAGVRRYIVQFGAGGPFEDYPPRSLRAASVNEEKCLDGVTIRKARPTGLIYKKRTASDQT